MTFQELNIKRKVKDAVAKAGYTEPSPVQALAIPAIMKGCDVTACAQTGTGKTAAFALPILSRMEVIKPKRIRALVLTPTRELAMQIFDNFKMYGRYLPLRTACIYGGAKQHPQISALARGADILVATPGRLMDFMRQGFVDLDDIEIFVLDEADRMLDMGFITDVKKIVSYMSEDRQTVMFSATMPPRIQELARELLKSPVSINIEPEIKAADTVEQRICFSEKKDKTKIIGSMLMQDKVDNAIVFTGTKHGADKLVRELGRQGIASMAIHGDKTQGQRIQALQRFKSGQINVLVATDVASRGIDIPKLKYVFNYNLPVEAESYIHRIGRTGRAGESGEAVTLCSADEIDLLADIEQLLGREITELKTEWSVDIERKSRKRRHDRSTGKGGRKFNRNRHERSFESKKISNSLKIKKDVRSEKNNRKSYNKKTSGKFIPKK